MQEMEKCLIIGYHCEKTKRALALRFDNAAASICTHHAHPSFSTYWLDVELAQHVHIVSASGW